MKAFFVGDNRTSPNWGRGASIALGQLLSGAFEVSARLTGDTFVLSTAPAGYVNTLMPARYYGLFRRLLQNRRRRRLVDWYLRFERCLGARDFISGDPVDSINTLLARRNRYPALEQLYQHANAADLVVIDGDGDIVFSTPPRREALFLLAMIELGLRLRKPVFLVNTMISDCPLSGRNAHTLAAARRLLAHCRAVALRDPESLEYVQREMPGVNCCYIPDSLFSWYPLYEPAASQPPPNGDFLLPYPEREDSWGRLHFAEPYICIGGGALASSQPDRAGPGYAQLVEAIKTLGCKVYLTENDTPDSFLQAVARDRGVGLVPVGTPILMGGAVLANARLFISGRYHPSIFAALGGTPCIFLGSHAHKMQSLARVLEYEETREFGAFPNESDIGEIVAVARRHLHGGDALRGRLRHVAKMRCEEANRLPAYIQRHATG